METSAGASPAVPSCSRFGGRDRGLLQLPRGADLDQGHAGGDTAAELEDLELGDRHRAVAAAVGAASAAATEDAHHTTDAIAELDIS